MKMPLVLATALLAVTPLFAGPLVFESNGLQVKLLELFTSEGCSSCPPADVWMSKLKTSEELWKSVVPVAFHVDYWNGLGWPDRFGTRAYADRQRRYAAAWRSDSVYTPGVVLNGREWRDWYGREVPAAAVTHAGRLQVMLSDGLRAEVVYVPESGSPIPKQVEIALLGVDLETDVKRGENGGRKLRHDFVALSLTAAELKPIRESYVASVTLPQNALGSATALAAWVTTGEGQPPIQATGGWLHRPTSGGAGR